MRARASSGGMPKSRSLRRHLADARFLAVAWALLSFYRAALWIAPYRLVKRALPSRKSTRPAPAWAQARVRWAVSEAKHATVAATCLPQAMTAHTLLAVQGYASIIRIGVRRGENGAIQAHAWVLADDAVVIGDDGERLESFAPLTDLGRGR